MSRYGMPIHKFIRKRNPSSKIRTPFHNDIFWLPKEVTHKAIRRIVNRPRWEIFAQRAIEIQPRSSASNELGYGVRMTRGVCLVSLRQAIKEKGCSLQDGSISEDVEDIVITIQNNSESVVSIDKADSLCYINYHVYEFNYIKYK